MPQTDLEHILRRARVYTGFRKMLAVAPEVALAGYRLSPPACAALLSRDADALLALGVESELAGWWCIIAAPEPPDAADGQRGSGGAAGLEQPAVKCIAD